MTARFTGGGRGQVVLIPDQTAISNMLSGRTGDLRRVMAGFAGQATVKARQLAGQRLKPRSGNYIRSIHSTFPKPDEFRVESSADYAAALELGTTPHGIVGNPLLRWPPSRSNTGKWVTTPAVSHPGNRPYQILTDAVLETAKDLGF